MTTRQKESRSMAITEEVVAEIATVEVNDEYRVELWQFKKTTDYSPDQAAGLGLELIRAAASARQMVQADGLDAADRIRRSNVLRSDVD